MEPDKEQIGRITDPAGEKNFSSFLQTRTFAACLALASFCLILIYVFVLTDYKNYLVSDMAGFWQRALERIDGKTFHFSQYWAWPAGYHIILAELFRILRWIGLESLIRLETALTLNILLYSISVYAMQRMAVRWFANPPWALIVTLLYGFGFPAWYFNAFLLSENPAIPCLVMAVALLYCWENWKSIILAAVLFGFATIVRPSIGSFGLAFVLYLLIRWRLSWQFVARAAVFSIVFFALFLGGGMEVSRISHGQVKTLSPQGGLQFFMANSRYHQIDLFYNNTRLVVISPAVAWNPENGCFKTTVPFYNQAYYLKLGWDHVKHDPLRLIKNFEHVKDLFFQRMFPGIETIGYLKLKPVWDGFKFLMFLSLGLYFWMWRGLSTNERPLFGLLISTIGLTLLTSYLFTGEPRYTYAILFSFYLLFFKIIEQFWNNGQRWKKVLLPFAALIIFGAGIVWAGAAVVYPDYPSSMRMDILTSSDSPENKPQTSQNIKRLYFPYNYYSRVITHADTGYRPTSPTRFTTYTDVEITGSDPLPIKFDICTVWPYQMRIDGIIAADDQGNEADEPFLEKNAYVTLNPGKHTLEMVFDFVPRDGGFTFCYNYNDSAGWNHRHMVGISDERVKFTLPKVRGDK